MLDKDTAKNLAKELKIDLFTVYREYLQLLFLKYLYSKSGSEKICFKGETAIRFLLGSFRFSEDLDFTSMLEFSENNKLIMETVKDLNKEIVNVYFKKVKSMADSFSGKIYQNLENFNFPLSIRLDFSIREKPFHIDSSFIETIFPIGPYPQVVHLKPQEMLAEKVRAIILRTKGRDIFDLWFLLSKKIGIDWGLVNKKMLLYKRETNLSELITVIKKVPDKEIKNDLTRFLPISHRDLVSKVKELTIQKLQD